MNLIEYLVRNVPRLVNAKDKYQSTPLHFAAMRGNEVVTRALLATPSIDIHVRLMNIVLIRDNIGGSLVKSGGT